MIRKFIERFRKIIISINGEFLSSIAKGMIYETAVIANGGEINLAANM